MCWGTERQQRLMFSIGSTPCSDSCHHTCLQVPDQREFIQQQSTVQGNERRKCAGNKSRAASRKLCQHFHAKTILAEILKVLVCNYIQYSLCGIWCPDESLADISLTKFSRQVMPCCNWAERPYTIVILGYAPSDHLKRLASYKAFFIVLLWYFFLRRKRHASRLHGKYR